MRTLVRVLSQQRYTQGRRRLSYLDMIASTQAENRIGMEITQLIWEMRNGAKLGLASLPK